jgi:hypothetical protein
MSGRKNNFFVFSRVQSSTSHNYGDQQQSGAGTQDLAKFAKHAKIGRMRPLLPNFLSSILLSFPS